jgi:hypothetical protein
LNKTNNNLGISFLSNKNNKNKNCINNSNYIYNNRNIIKNNNYKFNSFINHKSLYSLLKNNQMIGNSPLKFIDSCKNNNIIKKFIKFSNNISKTKNKENKENIINKEIKTEKNINTKNNNEFILKIKDSLDDNLKHILNFSYENFLNKESERDCN